MDILLNISYGGIAILVLCTVACAILHGLRALSVKLGLDEDALPVVLTLIPCTLFLFYITGELVMVIQRAME